MTFRIAKENDYIPGIMWFSIVDTPDGTPFFDSDDCWCLLISGPPGAWISYRVAHNRAPVDTPELTKKFIALLSDEQKAKAIAFAIRNRSNT